MRETVRLDHMTYRPQLLTTELAALAAGVQPGTIRQWNRRGKLTPRAGTERHPLYNLADVMRNAKPADQPTLTTAA